MSSISDVQDDVTKARADVRADFEALGRELGRDERQAKARLHQYAPALVAGAGAIGVLVGLGGPKWIKRLLVIGALGGAAAAVIRRHGV